MKGKILLLAIVLIVSYSFLAQGKTRNGVTNGKCYTVTTDSIPSVDSAKAAVDSTAKVQ